MDQNKIIHKCLTLLIALVWLINGLFCKILNLVPRHKDIVGKILGTEYAKLATMLIGFGELAIFIWIIIGFKSKACALLQIALVGSMNIIEFIIVPDLLLFGRLNILIALLFMILIFVNEFVLFQADKKMPLH